MTVAEALERFVAERNELGASTDKFTLNIGKARIPFPNPGKLEIHDVHHAVLGVPADFWGEVQVSAFELRSGAPTLLIWLLCVGALGLGLCVRPREVAVWLRDYRGTKNLYREPDIGALMHLDVEELRAKLGITS